MFLTDPEREEILAAWHKLRDTFLDALYIPQIVAWLNRRFQ